MNEQDKELLLKDLCARLPYQTVVKWREQDVVLTPVMIIPYLNEGCKPYLRPMSSMTEEEKAEYKRLCVNAAICNDYQQVDYLNSKHLDYRGLIPMNLALETPEDMYNK